MTRGIFDPNSDNVMKGAGNSFLGDPGIERSKMPPGLVDGEAAPDDATALPSDADTNPDGDLTVIDDELQPEFSNDPATAADSLMHIEVEDEGQVDIDEGP